MQNVALIRVGVDSGCGGIQGPLFEDGSFEFICIPDKHNVGEFKYGSTKARNSERMLIDFFPSKRKSETHLHHDPEFETFTYGEPSPNKSSLKNLKSGDLLAFYAGLKPFKSKYEENSDTGLYLVALFEVESRWTKECSEFPDEKYRNNFHVKHPEIFAKDKDRLIVVKGGAGSRVYQKAHKISQFAEHNGRNYLVLADTMKEHFGEFTQLNAIERSAVRWVKPDFVQKAATFLRSLN